MDNNIVGAVNNQGTVGHPVKMTLMEGIKAVILMFVQRIVVLWE